jgi:hypothetical protein
MCRLNALLILKFHRREAFPKLLESRPFLWKLTLISPGHFHLTGYKGIGDFIYNRLSVL